MSFSSSNSILNCKERYIPLGPDAKNIIEIKHVLLTTSSVKIAHVDDQNRTLLITVR